MGWSIPQAVEPAKITPWSPWICVFIIGAGYLAALVWVVLNSPASGLPPLSSGVYLSLTGYTLVGVLGFLALYLLWWEVQALRYFNHFCWQSTTYTAWQSYAQEHLCVLKAITLTSDPGLLGRKTGVDTSAPVDDENTAISKTLLVGEALTPGISRFEQLCRALIKQVAPALKAINVKAPLSVYLQTTGDTEEAIFAKLQTICCDLFPEYKTEVHILPAISPFTHWNKALLSLRHPVLILAMHYRQPDESKTEIASALLLSPPELLTSAEQQVTSRLFRAMPVNIGKLADELGELRDITQQPAESIRLIWFSGLSDSVRQQLSAVIHELKLPLRTSAPGGGLLDFDKDNEKYSALSGWLLPTVAAEMVAKGQGSQWLLCADGDNCWAMVAGNQAPVLREISSDLPDEPWPAGCMALTLLLNLMVFWSLGTAWPQWLFSVWGIATIVVTLFMTLICSVLVLRELIEQLQKPQFIEAANASLRE